MHQSIPLAPSPPPPLSELLRGIFPPCQSRGWGIGKFCTARGPGICQPRGHSRGDLQLMEIRERVPLPWARVARSLAAKVPSREGGVHWNALLSYEKVHSVLYFVFLQKALVWEITGAEFSKSTTHTADEISVRFPRVTRIRYDKDWETANDLPHLRVSYTGLIPGGIQKNCPYISHFKIF